MDIIGRAAGLFDKVYVTVMININKKGTVPMEDRIALRIVSC